MDILKAFCLVVFLVLSLVQATCNYVREDAFIPAPVELVPPPDNTALLHYLDSSRAMLDKCAAEIRRAQVIEYKRKVSRNAPIIPADIGAGQTKIDTCR